MPAKTTKPKQSKKQEQQEKREHTSALLSRWLKQNALDGQHEDVKSRITAEDAKVILGWSEVEKDHHLVDCEGRKIVCLNNLGNRAWREADSRKVAQDILNRQFSYNGESIVVGINNEILSGQTRLIGLVFAEQLRTGPQSAHWSMLWEEPCYIEALVVYNIDSSLKTTRTIDQTRPRTVADALYTDPDLAKYKPLERKQVSRLLDHAIRTVWLRTGHKDNLFHSRKTNAELLSFKERHPRIVKAVKHIYDENGTEQRISGPGRWLNAGVAAGLLYLMGCAASEGDAYRAPKKNKDGIVEVSEKGLDWSLWEKACEFWVMLAAADLAEEFIKNMRKVRRPVEDSQDCTSGFVFSEGSTNERAAAVAKAWKVYLSGKKPTPGLFKLAYRVNEHTGLPVLDEDPTVGGIDLGNMPYKPEVSESVNGSAPEVATDPTPEQIQAEAEAIRNENAQAAGSTYSGNLD